MAESESFVVYLNAESGVDLRIDNSGIEQRDALTDHGIGDKLVVLGDMTDVTHGTYSKGGDPATLIVMKFKFQTGSSYRRFKSAKITVKFFDIDDALAGPAVKDLAPDDVWSILPSKKSVELTHKGIVGAQAGIDPVKANLGYECELKETSEKENTARVEGAIRLLGRDTPPRNAVIWNLIENPDTEKGIPTLLQTAILLKREKPVQENEPEKKFQATIEVEAEVDRKSAFIDWIKGKPHKDEPIIFNPKLSPQGRKFDAENLGGEDLEKLQKIVSLKKWEG